MPKQARHMKMIYIKYFVIGKFGKGREFKLSSGYCLLNFAKLHNMRLTNTFFRHKPAHISTWEAMDRTSVRQDAASGNIIKTPYRNQIDCILTVNSFKCIQILDARSYGGMTTRSDHKIVLMKSK